MNNQTSTPANYQQLAQNQAVLSREMRELRTKFKIMNSLKQFDQATKKLEAFARKKGITKADVLKDD